MIRQPFSFHAPRTVTEAVQLLGELGDEAKLLAGGQSLMPAMNLGVIAPRHVVSLNRLRSALSYVREEGSEIAIGALTTHHTLATSGLLRKYCPIVAEAAGDIGDVQVRHRGTVGGSTAHFDPAADYPPVCLALNAKFRLTGPSGERTVAAEDFFVGYMMTAVEPREILTEVRVPVLSPGTGSAYAKHRRIEGGFAIVGVAAVVAVQSDLCQQLTVGVSGGGAVPFRLKEVEARYRGKRLDDAAVREIADAAYVAATEPTNELHADAAYKRDMVRVFTRRAVKTAAERALR
jgi:aerobic carbon-monoxide dehydrogenase medium subunit